MTKTRFCSGSSKSGSQPILNSERGSTAKAFPVNSVAGHKPQKRTRWLRRDTSLAYLLIAPTVAVLLALSVYPLIYAVKVAFQSGTGESAHWTFEHFTRLASD